MNLDQRRGAIEVRVRGGSVLAYRCDDQVEPGDEVVIETGIHRGRIGVVTSTFSAFQGALHDARLRSREDLVAEAKADLEAAERRYDVARDALAKAQQKLVLAVLDA